MIAEAANNIADSAAIRADLILLGATVIIAILAGIWVYRDAKIRDGNPLIWVISFVFISLFTAQSIGPLGVLIVLLFYLITRPKGKIDKCPHCEKLYLFDLAYCPHCKKQTKKDCLKCHDLVPYGQVKCPHCGAWVPRD